LIVGVLSAVSASSVAAVADPGFRIDSAMRLARADGADPDSTGVKIVGRIGVRVTRQGIGPPVVTNGRILLPRGMALHPRRYRICAMRGMHFPEDGIDDCPERSVIGFGQAESYADSVTTEFKVKFYNAGAQTIWAYTTLYMPALVREPVAIRIRKIARGKWSNQLAFTVPEILQVIAGIPISAPPNFHFDLGGRRYIQEYVTLDRSCPERGFLPFRIEIGYLVPGASRGTLRHRGRIACRKV